MSAAQHVVNALLEGESPKDFIKRKNLGLVKGSPGALPDITLDAYLRALLRLSENDQGYSLMHTHTVADYTEWALKEARADCVQFWKDTWEWIKNAPEQAGRDFAYTRSSQEPYFSDFWPEAVRERLNDFALRFGFIEAVETVHGTITLE